MRRENDDAWLFVGLRMCDQGVVYSYAMYLISVRR